MNPIRLVVKNFRNYKNLDISFDNSGVIPIVGKNGHGKSSIFDAILLANFGKIISDGTEIPIIDLIINDGSQEMSVELWFSHNNKEYKILRVYKQTTSKNLITKCDQVKCEFYQLFGDSEPIVLTAKNKTNTTNKIIEILGKDCDNFCNSVFFPQGEENRLAKLKPAEFIEEISKLKGIVIWESLRKKCKEELDKTESVLSGVNSYIEECKEDIALKDEIQIQIKELNEKIINKRLYINNIENSLVDLSNQKSTLNSKIENISRIENDINDINEEIAELKDDIIFTEDKVKEYDAIINNKNNILSDSEKYNGFCNSKKELDKALIDRNRLMGDISKIETEVKNAEYNAIQNLNNFINRKTNAVNILNNSNAINERYNYCLQFMQSLDLLQVQYDNLLQSNQQTMIEITKLTSRNEQLTNNISEETEKVKRIINTCTCSECERPVDANGLEQIKAHKSSKIDNYKIEGLRNIEQINNLNNLIRNNKNIIDDLKQKLSSKGDCNLELGQLQNKISHLNEANKEVQLVETLILEWQSIINNGTYSDKLDLLNSLRGNLKDIIYNSEEHNSINSKCNELKSVELKLHILNDAEKECPNLKQKYNDYNKKLDIKTQKLTDLISVLNNSNKNEIIKSKNEIEDKELVFKKDLNENKGIFDIIMKELGGKQSILENILYKENKIEEKLKEVLDIKKRQYLLERAMTMYSKQGIPTLIIESMLPDIEKEANQLLHKMDSDHSICFERPKRADGTNMDKIIIMVRDRRGKKRPFNTYSGAECFQISFALRVAICGSEDVMFIDEGFGKLDADNRKLIIKTLGTLKTKFDKIILITHVESFIDMFDIKLDVKLDAKGYSTAQWTKG